MAVACSPPEATRLSRLPLSDRVDAFLALWTLKEAYLKALGVGFARDPRSIEIAFGPNGRATIVDPSPSEGAPPLQLRRLDAGQGWAAALAYGGREARVRERAWP